jgi:hypothetical protein
MIDIKEIQGVFFEAMKKGWVARAEKITIPHLPGVKAIPFKKGGFYVLDYYFVNPFSQKSFGTTQIWFQDNPVWVMYYGGFYNERVIPFLKRALSQTYQNRNFVGGRGPEWYEEEPLVYVNHAMPKHFERFKGNEEVYDSVRKVSLGWHDYWGMVLL